jgi:hypothetical protein
MIGGYAKGADSKAISWRITSLSPFSQGSGTVIAGREEEPTT